MKIISILTGIITVLLLLSTLLCGLWIKSHNLNNNTESLVFHTKIGVATVIFGLISTILLMLQVMKH